MCCIEVKCKWKRPRSSAFRPLNVISPQRIIWRSRVKVCLIITVSIGNRCIERVCFLIAASGLVLYPVGRVDVVSDWFTSHVYQIISNWIKLIVFYKSVTADILLINPAWPVKMCNMISLTPLFIHCQRVLREIKHITAFKWTWEGS